MGSILDYVKWRGDLTFEKDEFNEIDNVILARLSYFDFAKVMGAYEEELLLDEVYRRYSRLSLEEKNILWKEDDELFPLMAMSKRYRDCKLTRFVNNIDLDSQKQFSAITIILPDNSIFVSYRGTDNTIVGWKEDFNLSFQDDVPAQLESVKYLEEIAKAYPDNKIRLSGHSKGGNLAIYAASFCDNIETSVKEVSPVVYDGNSRSSLIQKLFNKTKKNEIELAEKKYKLKDRIIGVYNNDGPGLSDQACQKEGYQKILTKIHTYIPRTSIIGRMLFHEEKMTIVESTQLGLLQHDVYSWQLEGKNFERADDLDKESVLIDDTIKDWLVKSTNEERGVFVDMVYDILLEANVSTVQEMKKNWFESAKKAYKKYKDIDDETKEVVSRALKLLWEATRENVFSKKESGESQRKIKKLDT